MKRTVRTGAQNVGKERGTVLPEQDTELKAKMGFPCGSDGDPTMRETQI